MKAPVPGGAPATVEASGLNGPWGLVVTSSWIYVTESGAGRVIRMPR